MSEPRVNSLQPCSALSENTIAAMIVDRSGILWIGTQSQGLNRFDPATECAEIYQHDPNDAARLGSNAIRCLLEDRTGDLWIATEGGGLDRLDPDTGQFAHVATTRAIPTA